MKVNDLFETKVNDLFETKKFNNQEVGMDERRKQHSFSHQLDVLFDKLRKYEDQDLIKVTAHQDLAPINQKAQLSYNLSVREQMDRTRYVYLLMDNPNMNKHIESIVNRINQIHDLGGVYF